MAIGTKDFTSDKITNNVSVLDWVSRLFSLTGPVKKYTQNYMIDHIMRAHDRDFDYFSLPTSQEFSFFDLFKNDKNNIKIKASSDELINTNMPRAQRIIYKMVKERFAHLEGNCDKVKKAGGNVKMAKTFEEFIKLEL